MKVNDLRIGNWIKYEDKLVQVVQLSSLMILCQRDENQFLVNCAPEVFQPIELTEDILMKIGFKKERQLISYLFYLDYEIDKNNIIWVKYIIYPKDPSLLRIITSQSGNYECFEFIKRGIRYLHELQNAYYLLTGEELEVEL